MPAAEIDDIWIGPDHHVHYDGARDEATGTYLNTGTCTFAFKTAVGATLATGTCTYVAASSGNYLGVIDGPTYTASLTDGAFYKVEITFVQGGYDDVRTLWLRARKRGRT